MYISGPLRSKSYQSRILSLERAREIDFSCLWRSIVEPRAIALYLGVSGRVFVVVKLPVGTVNVIIFKRPSTSSTAADILKFHGVASGNPSTKATAVYIIRVPQHV
ncbi:hypothetical protein TNCT_138301 [Trichonephila clavata]|uniref:Uncharacterized protein n=1 Tax=Trichonephila clavata TaxID=2740835 RepID=A0A8X6HD25_TRICU|nr:hypothetical protein TNCT_138301 [Trichonephila clavata]